MDYLSKTKDTAKVAQLSVPEPVVDADVPSTTKPSSGATPKSRATMMLRLQRSVGNLRAGEIAGAEPNPLTVSAQSDPASTIDLPPSDVVHPVAATLADSTTRFRLPTFADLKDAYTNKSLKIPEAVIKDRVGELLDRMERDKRLKTKDPVPTILAKIFPGPGLIVGRNAGSCSPTRKAPRLAHGSRRPRWADPPLRYRQHTLPVRGVGVPGRRVAGHAAAGRFSTSYGQNLWSPA